MKRRAFTLIELTIVIAIIGILAMLALAAASSAYQQSKVQRTQAIVAKIDQLIGEKWEAYRTRPVAVRINHGTPPQQAAIIRRNALHELMRMEMPDRQSDVIPSLGGNPVVLTAAPAIWKQYNRRALATWSNQHENAECLYLVLASMRDGDKSALDFFSPSEIGDVDDDGMNEILDSFGQPIAWLRWAPGYLAPQVVTSQYPVGDPNYTPDEFDPAKVDARQPYSLRPLVFSSGPDKRADVNVGGGGFAYALTNPPNDPYYNGGVLIGTPIGDQYADNITNHDAAAK